MVAFPLSSRSPNAAVRRPKQLTYYSLDITRTQSLESKSQLKHFYLPDSFLNKRPNLNKGYEKFINREKLEENEQATDHHLDHLLKAVLNHEKERNGGKKLKAEILTYRGVMTKLLTLAEKVEQNKHSNKHNINRDTNKNSSTGGFGPDDFAINIRYFDGQLFFEFDHAADQLRKAASEEGRSEEEKQRLNKLTYHGYKFETVSMLPRPWSECTREDIDERQEQVVDNMCEYCVVVRSGVGKIKTILGAEVDGIWDYDPTANVDLFGKGIEEQEMEEEEEEEEEVYKPLFDTRLDDNDMLPHYVELKTTMCVTNTHKAGAFLTRKLLTTWAQSFLIGVTHVVYGFRDDAGVLKAIEAYKTDELPKMVQQATFLSDEKKWKGNDCIAFYAAVLQWVVDTVPKDENQVWRLEYHDSNTQLTLNRLGDAGLEQKLLDEMLLKEFVDWRKSLE